jgi:hypothetical protein
VATVQDEFSNKVAVGRGPNKKIALHNAGCKVAAKIGSKNESNRIMLRSILKKSISSNIGMIEQSENI